MTTDENPDPRRRILDAAERLLSSSPDGDVSTREICRQAGVSAPTLYHHFGDKDGLLHAVVAEGFQDYLARKRELTLSEDPALELRHGWDMHVTFGVTHPSHYRLMFGAPGTGPQPPAALAAHDELRAIVTRWERSGRLALPIESATDVLQAMAVGVTLRLIDLGADATHPLSLQMRDLAVTALLRPARSPDAAVPAGAATLAGELREALPEGAVGPLRAPEVALLHLWLADLGDAAPEKGQA